MPLMHQIARERHARASPPAAAPPPAHAPALPPRERKWGGGREAREAAMLEAVCVELRSLEEETEALDEELEAAWAEGDAMEDALRREHAETLSRELEAARASSAAQTDELRASTTAEAERRAEAEAAATRAKVEAQRLRKELKKAGERVTAAEREVEEVKEAQKSAQAKGRWAAARKGVAAVAAVVLRMTLACRACSRTSPRRGGSID